MDDNPVHFFRMLQSDLETHGVVVYSIPECILAPFDARTFLQDMPEFIHDAPLSLDNHAFVLGAFGALGNPSSYHHPAVRALRRRISDYMLTEFFPRTQYADHFVQHLPDRFCIRRKGTAPARE
eukprot:gene9686-10712_t